MDFDYRAIHAASFSLNGCASIPSTGARSALTASFSAAALLILAAKTVYYRNGPVKGAHVGRRAKDTDEKIQAMLHSKGDCHLQRREGFGIIHFPRVGSIPATAP
jgi:hypothetical protein